MRGLVGLVLWTALVTPWGTGCNGEFRTYLPDGGVWEYPEVVTLVDERIIRFPAAAGDARGGINVNFKFDVPREAISVGVMMAGNPSGAYTVGRWTDGDEQTLVDIGGDPLCIKCTNPVSVGEMVFAGLAPNNRRGRFAAGTHRFVGVGQRYTFNPDAPTELERVMLTSGPVDPDGSSIRLSVFAKITPTLPDTGILDMNLHFAGGAGRSWTAANGPTNPEVNAVLDTLEQILGQAGIRLGRITYHEVDARFAEIENVGGPKSDRADMLETGTTEDGVNVFFIDDFFMQYEEAEMATDPEEMPKGFLLGIAGGIPGPFVNGTPMSGVTVGTRGHEKDGVFNPESLGQVLAHELGHELGLFHVIEFTGFTLDRHDDTDRSCDFLMYPALNSLDDNGNLVPCRDTLSVEQGKALRRNPRIRHDEDDMAAMAAMAEGSP